MGNGINWKSNYNPDWVNDVIKSRDILKDLYWQTRQQDNLNVKTAYDIAKVNHSKIIEDCIRSFKPLEAGPNF